MQQRWLETQDKGGNRKKTHGVVRQVFPRGNALRENGGGVAIQLMLTAARRAAYARRGAAAALTAPMVMTRTESRMAREGTLPKKKYSSSMVKMMLRGEENAGRAA